MATPATAVSDRTDEQATDTTTFQTLSDINPGSDCLSVSEKVRVSASRLLQFNPEKGEVFTDAPFSRPDWGSADSGVYRCVGCGDEFKDEETAVAHLLDQNRRSRRFFELPGVLRAHSSPSLDAEPLTFGPNETVETIEGKTVRGRSNADGTAMHLFEPVDYFLATAREEYELPEETSLEEWDPLTSGGRLTFPSGHPRFDPEIFAQAVSTFASWAGSRFSVGSLTLYDRGERAFLLTGYGNDVLIAPRINHATHP